jgi:hypothetical protein
MSYAFKWAETPAEYDAIRRLNHITFAEELGQHELQQDGVLVDRFEEKSRYAIAIADGEVVGMIAVHSQPPWSIEKRLPSPQILNALPERKLEVRLLAVHPSHRTTMVLAGLLTTVIDYVFTERFAALLISGVTDRVSLYERLGFHAVGEPVPDGCVSFVPMALVVADLPPKIIEDIARWRKRSGESVR